MDKENICKIYKKYKQKHPIKNIFESIDPIFFISDDFPFFEIDKDGVFISNELKKYKDSKIELKNLKIWTRTKE